MSITIRPAVKGDLDTIVKIAQLVAPYAENIPYLYPEEYRQDHLKRLRKGYRFCLFSPDFILMVAKVPDSGTPGDIDMQGSKSITACAIWTKVPKDGLNDEPVDITQHHLRGARQGAGTTARKAVRQAAPRYERRKHQPVPYEGLQRCRRAGLGVLPE
ncbi:hypothetical protein QC761_206815 [Podospora bellae-mahoneyi]|uniref:N-acetyltransferase domain-containing protein n=1 Tax=Podospora bellae-mahoneyi TaxID=2093777 RepID=A0ABR0FPY1_9PEZI|nr:hypothetical protein QC761_206815 [Podospora bellae-mahoneyi]